MIPAGPAARDSPALLAARDAAGDGMRRVAALIVAARLAAFPGLAMLVLDRRDG